MKYIFIYLFCFRFLHGFSQDTNYVNTLNKQALEYISINTDSAMLLAREALRLSNEINFDNGKALALNRIGLAFKNMGNYDSALFYYQKNLIIRIAQNNKAGKGSTYQNIGYIYKRIGLNDSAQLYYENARKLHLELGDEEKAFDNLMSLANIERLKNNFEKALGYFKECELYYIENKKTKSLQDIYLNLGILYDDLKSDTLNSRIYYRKSLEYLKGSNNTIAYARVYSGLANSYYKSADYDKSLKYADSAFVLYDKLHDKSNAANVVNTIASIYLEQKKYAQAAAYFEITKNTFEETGEFDDLKDVYGNLATVYAETGNYKEAYLNFAKYKKLDDSIFTARQSFVSDSLSAAFETEKKIQENIILKKEKVITNEQAEKQKLKNSILLISLIALCILSALIFFNFRQRQHITKKDIKIKDQKIDELLSTQEIKSLNAMMEGQETERKRIAQDLHDRMGSLLSTVKLHFNSLETKVESYQKENKEQFTKLNSLLDEAVGEVRRISHNLVSGVLLQFGLVPALRELCENIQDAGHIKIDFIAHGVDERLDNQAEISIYRIIQELLSNILKHAQATEATIQLTRHDQELTVMVEDNGKGFDTGKELKGIGLKNIESRVEKLNGNFTIDSVPGKGTTSIINILIPQ